MTQEVKERLERKFQDVRSHISFDTIGVASKTKRTKEADAAATTESSNEPGGGGGSSSVKRVQADELHDEEDDLSRTGGGGGPSSSKRGPADDLDDEEDDLSRTYATTHFNVKGILREMLTFQSSSHEDARRARRLEEPVMETVQGYTSIVKAQLIEASRASESSVALHNLATNLHRMWNFLEQSFAEHLENLSDFYVQDSRPPQKGKWAKPRFPGNKTEWPWPLVLCFGGLHGAVFSMVSKGKTTGAYTHAGNARVQLNSVKKTTSVVYTLPREAVLPNGGKGALSSSKEFSM